MLVYPDLNLIGEQTLDKARGAHKTGEAAEMATLFAREAEMKCVEGALVQL